MLLKALSGMGAGRGPGTRGEEASTRNIIHTIAPQTEGSRRVPQGNPDGADTESHTETSELWELLVASTIREGFLEVAALQEVSREAGGPQN